MAARLIEPTDSIDVTQICVLLYGQPGSRKSSMIQTAKNPITLAFDPGIYRAFGRKRAAVFESWADVVTFDTSSASTVCVDTAGMALEKLGQAIVAESPKNGNRLGGLSLQGYGVLKSQFAQWVNSIKAKGQDVVFTAHEKAEKNGDDTYYCPDIVGGSYTTLMNHCDVVGYLHFENGKRVVDFNPTDRWMAKTPPCGWKQIILPDFSESPDFLASLIAEAKASMGRISTTGAEIAKAVDDAAQKMGAEPTMDTINAVLAQHQNGEAALKAQIFALAKKSAEPLGLKWDGKARKFIKGAA